MNSKERAKLRSISVNIEPVMQIGKSWIEDKEQTKNALIQADTLLSNREIIKITVLKNCNYEPKEVISQLCEELDCEPVHVIGNKVVIYRYSNKEGITHIL